MHITACTNPSYFTIDGMRNIHEISLQLLLARGLLENADEIETMRGEFIREQAFALQGAEAVAMFSENAHYRLDEEGGIMAGREFAFEDFDIPDGVKIVRKSGFRGIACLKSVTFPSSVEVIEEDAFNGCKNLASVTFSYGLKSIYHRAFQDTALAELTLPASVEFISPRNVFPRKPLYAYVDRCMTQDCIRALSACGLRARYGKV